MSSTIEISTDYQYLKKKEEEDAYIDLDGQSRWRLSRDGLRRIHTHAHVRYCNFHHQYILYVGLKVSISGFNGWLGQILPLMRHLPVTGEKHSGI